MTLDEAQRLARLLCEAPDDCPRDQQSLCTCVVCMRDYAIRLNAAFPSYQWTSEPDPDAGGFGLLRVEEKPHA